jgi:hypothetical protein
MKVGLTPVLILPVQQSLWFAQNLKITDRLRLSLSGNPCDIYWFQAWI